MKLHRENPHFATLAQTDTVMSLDKRWHHCLDLAGAPADAVLFDPDAMSLDSLELGDALELYLP